MPQSNTKIYYPVTHKKRAGALIATEDSVAFHDDEKNGNKVVELHWHEVARINCNVATSPTALLKLTTIRGQTPTFKLESRKELEKAKADMKAYWKAAHEESIRDCDDEDFSESKRDGDDLLYMPPSPKRNQSTKARSKTPPKTRSKTPPKTGVAQQQRFANAKRRASTGHLPRIDSGHSLKWPPAAATDTSTDSYDNLYYPKWNVQPPQKQQNHGFSKASHVHLLPKDQIQLPRAAGGQFQLDFSNFGKTQQLPVFILHSNGTIGATQTLKLEELLTEKKDQTDIEEAQAVHAEDGYQISRRVCVTSLMAVACGVCVMLLMAVALVVLSILLWEQQNESDSGGGGLGTDDFYAGYFNQRPP